MGQGFLILASVLSVMAQSTACRTLRDTPGNDFRHDLNSGKTRNDMSLIEDDS